MKKICLALSVLALMSAAPSHAAVATATATATVSFWAMVVNVGNTIVDDLNGLIR